MEEKVIITLSRYNQLIKDSEALERIVTDPNHYIRISDNRSNYFTGSNYIGVRVESMDKFTADAVEYNNTLLSRILDLENEIRDLRLKKPKKWWDLLKSN
jgi:hypothetical protein